MQYGVWCGIGRGDVREALNGRMCNAVALVFMTYSGAMRYRLVWPIRLRRPRATEFLCLVTRFCVFVDRFGLLGFRRDNFVPGSRVLCPGYPPWTE